MKEEEDKDNFGNKGFYTMNEDFSIVMLSTTEDEDDIQEIIKNLPDKDSFEVIQVYNWLVI